MDSGLDTMERNVLQAELRGDFSIRAVEAVLKKHWTDSDVRKRDAEKGRFMAHAAMEDEDAALGYNAEWSPDDLEAEGFSAQEVEAMVLEEEKAREAWAVLQDARRTLRDARTRQHAMRMSRQFFPPRDTASQRPGGLWKQLPSSKPRLQCFRCGGPHKIAECKEKPRASDQANVNEKQEDAPFVFMTASKVEPCETALGTVNVEEDYLTTNQAVAAGKAVIDGGATRTIGSIEALEQLTDINMSKRGCTGIDKVDLADRPVFGFGNSSRNRCASTASVSVPMNGRLGSLRVHALDQGSAPILLSVDSLRRMGAVIDFENDKAVFRNVDARKVVSLERSSAGHQLMPLAEDMFHNAKELKQPLPSLREVE